LIHGAPDLMFGLRHAVRGKILADLAGTRTVWLRSDFADPGELLHERLGGAAH
jgi:hypothetical protein